MRYIINKMSSYVYTHVISFFIKRNFILFSFIFLSFFSTKTFSQANDSIKSQQISYRVGLGIFSIPGFYLEKNVSKKISFEAGIISALILSEVSVGLKYHIFGENNFKIKGGVGCGMTAYFWWAKTDPPKSGKEMYALPTIPIEFIFKRFSLELQPGYPISINGSDEAKIPIIVFLSYIIK